MIRTALITGSSRGIGRGIALALAGAGWRVVINYHSDAAAAEQTLADVRNAGGEGVIVRGDVAEEADRRRMVERTIEAFGGIDLLVNNAGVTSRGRRDILDAQEDDWDWLMGVNLKGPYFLTQLVARHMIQTASAATRSGGDAPPRAIVNVSSLSAYTVSTNRGDYCIAKAGMGMMTKLWAARLAEHGIRVYEVRPGVIESDMTAPVRAKYEKLIMESDPAIQPIRRWGTPGDVGRAVAALVSGAFEFTTGQVIEVDGGFHLRQV